MNPFEFPKLNFNDKDLNTTISDNQEDTINENQHEKTLNDGNESLKSSYCNNSL